MLREEILSTCLVLNFRPVSFTLAGTIERYCNLWRAIVSKQMIIDDSLKEDNSAEIMTVERTHSPTGKFHKHQQQQII